MRKSRPSLHLVVSVLLVLGAASAAALAQSPPPTPELTKVSPDRVAVGDLITLSGKNFLPPGTLSPWVIVHFGSIPVSVTPASDTNLSVLVPNGAKSGSVSITTAVAVNGHTESLTSNALDVLVIWREFDLTPILHPSPYFSGHIWRIIPGDADNFYLYTTRNTSYGYLYEIIRVNVDGTFARLYTIPGGSCSGYSSPARNPVSGDWIAIIPAACNWYEDAIADLTTGGWLYSWSYLNCTWAPEDLGMDGAGALYVLARRVRSSTFALWRFPSGSPITLDLSSPECLTPGGIEPLLGDSVQSGDLYVASNGTAYAYMEEFLSGEPVSSGTTRILQFLPGEPGYRTFPEPPHDPERPGITVATDCMGRGYAMNGSQWDPWIYGVESGQPLAYPTGLDSPGWIAADGYGDLYVSGINSAGKPVFRRVTPDEMPPGYYDDFTCCATNAPMRSIVHKVRGEQVQISCDIGALKIKLTPEPGDPISGDPGAPDQCNWIAAGSDGKASATVLFGQAPKLEAYWQDHPGAPDQGETVAWEVSGETAPNADPKGLFPTKPELLFTGGQSPYTSGSLQLQTVHTGTFVLKITTSNPQHKGQDGQPASVSITVTVAVPQGLLDAGAVHHEFDGMIVSYADKYGIPPQYIKSQVFRESNGTYDPTVYRYELKSRDLDIIAKRWSPTDWASYDYDMYRFPMAGTGTNFIDQDIAPRDRYSFISAYNFAAPWPYSCANYKTTDAHAYLWDLYEADDGWPPGSYPATVYPGHKGPCDRQNWLNKILTYLRHTDQFYCGSGVCGTSSGQATGYMAWFCNHPTYDAQTAVAASYGLLQVLYTTAVDDMQWNAGQGGLTRHPSYLFDPGTSLDLGTGYDARNIAHYAFGGSSALFVSLMDYQVQLTTGFQYYNKRSKDYGPDVVIKGHLFKVF